MNAKKTIWFLLIVMLLFGLAACGGDDGGTGSAPPPAEDVPTATPEPAGDAVAGEEQYSQICIACHGPGGEGIEGLGKPFTTSEFLRENSDQEMLDFIKVGRPSGDPANTTGVDMPPKGGNPALTDEQILDIIAYIRTLQ